MSTVLAVLFWLFIGWWVWHHRQYKRGKVNRPFFGKAPPRRAPALRRVPTPKTTTPTPARSGIVFAGGKAVYIKNSSIPATPQTPKPSPVPTPPPPASAALPPPPPPPAAARAPELVAGMTVQKHRRQPPKDELLMVPKEFPKPKRSPIEFPANLLYQLDDLTGDREISERLVRKIALNSPERDGRWCVEKALWDLRRDRF